VHTAIITYKTLVTVHETKQLRELIQKLFNNRLQCVRYVLAEEKFKMMTIRTPGFKELTSLSELQYTEVNVAESLSR
jgi:hypothetical protein